MKHRMVNSYCIFKYCTCDPYMGFSIWNRFSRRGGRIRQWGTSCHSSYITSQFICLTSSLHLYTLAYILYTWGNFRIQYQIQIGALSTRHSQNLHTNAEGIELFIKEQAFSSLMIWLLAQPLILSREQVVSLSQSSLCRWSSLLKRVGRWWERARSYDGEKAWSSIYYQILSDT